MNIAFAVAPLLLSVLAIALLQQSALRAGLIGIVSTIAIILTSPTFAMDVESFGRSVLLGLYNTLNISLILLGGVFLYRVLDKGGALTIIADCVLDLIDEPVHRLFALVFGASVFFESATGFGVGIVVVAPLYLALGYAPLQAAVLALLGQCAVPWGALAVGTVVGADISGVSELRLGALSAIFTLPVALLFGMLVLRITGLVSLRAIRILCLYALVLSVLLCLCSLLVGVELAGCLAGLLILVGAFMSTSCRKAGGKVVPARLSFALSAFIPFSVLMAALCITRLVPPVRQALQSIELHFTSDLSIAPLYHAGAYLLVSAGIGLLLFPRARAGFFEIASVGAQQWWLATLAVGGFVVFGQLMMDSGMTRHIAVSIARGTSGYYPLAAPWIGALGGFLTASNAASNALFMALQTTVATELSLPVDVISAGQNSAGSNVTLASPGRLIFAASIVGETGAESLLLKRVAGVTLAGVLSASLVSAALCWWL